MSVRYRFTNSKKADAKNSQAEKSPSSGCYSPYVTEGQDNSKKPEKSAYTPGNFIDVVTLEESKPANDMCCSCCKKGATRLCLNCGKICCDSCALDVHEDHKILKLSKVSESIENHKKTLYKCMSDVENLIYGKEGASESWKTKEDELMEQVDCVFERFEKALADQKQAIKSEIKKRFANAVVDSVAKSSGTEAFEWISSAKSLSVDIQEKKITDDNSLLCSLYQQVKRFEALDLSKPDLSCDPAALEKSLSEIQILRNDYQLLNALKNEKIVELKPSKSNKKKVQDLCDPEEAKTTEASQKAVVSDWRQNDLPKPTPVQKTDITRDLKKAFESKLEIQVKTQNDCILLESISKHNSKNPNVNNGLKNDSHVELFNEILTGKGLKESCEKVTDLTLDFFNLTEEGVKHLAKAISQLPSLQTVQLSFYMTLALYPIYLKPLFESLADLKSLKDFSLKLPTWTHLKGSAFLPLLSSISNISTLQSFSLDLSRCSKLDLKGVSNALKYFLRHEQLQKLQMCFKGCIGIENDDSALKSMYYNCLNSTFTGIKLDFSECPGLSGKTLDMIEEINQKKPYY